MANESGFSAHPKVSCGYEQSFCFCHFKKKRIMLYIFLITSYDTQKHPRSQQLTNTTSDTADRDYKRFTSLVNSFFLKIDILVEAQQRRGSNPCQLTVNFHMFAPQTTAPTSLPKVLPSCFDQGLNAVLDLIELSEGSGNN